MVVILADAKSRAGQEEPPLLDYTRHVVLPADGKTGAGLDVYVRSGTTTRATLLWGQEDANALSMEVLTPWGKHHVLAAHAPKINIGCAPYVRSWVEIWREVTGMVDPTLVPVVAYTNSAARPADKGTPRPDDTGYRTFLRVFNLRDLVDVHPGHQRRKPVSKGLCAPALTQSLATARQQSRWLPTPIGVVPSYPITMPPSSSPSPIQWPGWTSPAPYGVPNAGVPPGPDSPLPSGDSRLSGFGTPEKGHRPPTRPGPMAERPATRHL